ncbi:MULTISPECIES: 16S rRNA (guanine(966)-N(2))-methyltransferase RsmD [unclassified Pseudoalteromonas]|uniref:16S rRNA (guanine(966)-N(2))-methyltransferase RsmD n=1 Tax=unclassified Pseudoalteromonas TaxID=194690 RepID=UPI002097B678|nr:16S rRNA (guanine(966)-N(2))-methyltransferase RsmD [Pseudoalteromonas sp. XMcav2-N]MCO7188046.1 16S rRNA (guanine(966)-N(2))-methyltransferase RsmD [Pseudoalteromonas sp. XMcav2-N]
MRKQQSKKPVSGHIRVISGRFRGRKLPVKDVEGLRPTTDRVKETLFNWLMQDVRNAKVLDCFAGSGSLGFEALSRFAHSATFFEFDKQVAQQLQQNIVTLKLDNAQVEHGDTLARLATEAPQAYDLVFVDPPFRRDMVQTSCALLEANHWLSEDALVYVEFERESTPTFPENWTILKEKLAGQVCCRLFQRT